MKENSMKRLIISVGAILAASAAQAQVPVIDAANFNVAQQTARTTDEILNTNREVLDTVTETLAAVTGDRGSEASSMQDLAVANGFSVGGIPSGQDLMSGGLPDFGNMNDIVGVATQFINGLELVQRLSREGQQRTSGDQSYEEMVNTVLGVAALITGAQQGVENRTEAFQQASAQIGQAEDIKGSIDQNTQLQVQSGLTINELIGVMNGAVSSLQADNQRILTDMSNTRQTLTVR
jgi:hypothetical protein